METAPQDIARVLRRHRGHRTVLFVALPVLSAQIKAMKTGDAFPGLTDKEIAAGFRKLAAVYVASEYHPTYLNRCLGPRGFLEERNSRYRIKDALVEGSDRPRLEAIEEELRESLQEALTRRQAMIKRLEDACALPLQSIDQRYAVVEEYLTQLTGNRGEVFEVISFAVLREYFRTFGFSLQRFSTTHANDGGMDFVAGEAIYQVSTDEAMPKLLRDLAKSPGTKRVLVRPSATPEMTSLADHEILETIELGDLLNHFMAWLTARDVRSRVAKHLQQVLEVCLQEFKRENRAETARRIGVDPEHTLG